MPRRFGLVGWDGWAFDLRLHGFKGLCMFIGTVGWLSEDKLGSGLEYNAYDCKMPNQFFPPIMFAFHAFSMLGRYHSVVLVNSPPPK